MKISLYISLFIISQIVIVLCFGCKEDINKQDDSRESIHQLMKYCYINNIFNGTVLVAKDGEIIYENAFGFANFDKGKKLTINSVFNIGSVTKQFTSMAIMMLKEDGKLSYDDKFSMYFPNFPNSEKFTIRQLLTHTAGIPDYTNSRRFSQFRVPDHPGDFIDGITPQCIYDELVKLGTLDFEPGEQESYSNSGYVLLSMIVEKISGISFNKFLQKRVFSPLRMENSFVMDISESEIPNRAIGYTSFEDKDDANLLTCGDGGLCTTIRDLNKWGQGLYNNKLVSAETFSEALINPILNNGHPSRIISDSTWNYGFGWLFRINDKEDIIWHDGGVNCCTAIFYLDRKNNITLVLLSNKGSVAPYGIQKVILNILNDRPFTYPKVPISLQLKKLIDQNDLSVAVQKYKKLKNIDSNKYDFNINYLNSLGYYYLNHQSFEEAKVVLKLSIDLYPNNANVYDSYAEALMLNGEYDLALKYYKKSISLNPNNENGKRMLKSIEIQLDKNNL